MDLDVEFLALLNKSIISEELFQLIQLGANPNLLNQSGYSLIHILIFNQQVDKVLELVKMHKADINIKDKNGFPPLYYMLNDKFTIYQLIEMVIEGANPNIKTKLGTYLIHYLIKKDFKSVLDLLKLHPESINLKDAEGTPIQVMLNNRHANEYSADNYLNMVRCGADPNSGDKEGNSLLYVITQLGNLDKARELVALTKIPAKERIHYTPKLIDHFICEEGISSLFNALKYNEYTSNEIIRLAKFPLAKEKLMDHIKTLNPEEKEEIFNLCLTPTSSFNQFFSVQRGWFMTSYHRGTLAQIVKMKTELLHAKEKLTPQSEKQENSGHIRSTFCGLF